MFKKSILAKKINLTDNAKKVLSLRYLKKNDNGEPIEEPEDLFFRVAENIASIEKDPEKWTKIFYDVMANLEFLPNSPTLMNAGRELQQLSACFVIPVGDSMEEIFEAVKNTALIHKSGGGTGFSFSRLRPANDRVKSTKGVSSGPLSFMKVFDVATETVKQGGCVAPDSIISTDLGLVKILELFAPEENKPNTWYKRKRFTVASDNLSHRTNEIFFNGTVPVKKIITERGYNITSTPEHRFRVIDETGAYVWKYMKDLKKGDWVALQKNTLMREKPLKLPCYKEKIHFNANPITMPSETSKELGEYAGFLIGDGAMTLNKKNLGRVIFTIHKEDKDAVDYFMPLMERLFNLKPSIQEKKDDKGINYFFSSTVLYRWSKFVGISKEKSINARVPGLVFKGDREFVKGFLRGLFSADGAITDEGYVSLSSASKGLIEDVQVLLLSLGIPSLLRTIKRKEGDGSYSKKLVYVLNIITKNGLELFKKDISFFSSYKKVRLMDYSQKAWEFNDVIPNQEELFKKIYNGPGKGCMRGYPKGKCPTRGNRRLYRDISHYLKCSGHRKLQRSRLEYLANKHVEVRNNPIVQWFLGNNQFYDQIKSVENRVSPTLDISVPKSNTYIANGFVSHNTRRGANMGILRCDHPDILDFISIKEKDGILSNFNISVAITDEFMEALKEDKEYPLRNPRNDQIISYLKASEVFKKIVNCAWKNGEPGIIFIDKINDKNPTPHIGKIESTNPCGEQPLLSLESCNLGSINMLKVVDESNDIDFDKLENIVRTAVRFLDNVIDLNRYPLPSIDKMTKSNRKIGLGVMGFADMLIKLGIPYNSPEALSVAEKLMKFIQEKGREESRALAKERGVFPNFKGSIYDNGPELRNATITTIAPTGTLSMIASCSSGIEPLFSLVYEKNVLDGRKFLEIHPEFLRVAKQEGFYSENLMKQVMKSGGISKIEDIPLEIRDIFVTAHDIDPKTHINIQAAFQKYTDNAVSKTINFRHDATIEDVETAYKMAFESGCKGVTVYRDGSRGNQVMTVGSSDKSHKIIARDIKLPSVFNNGQTRVIKKEGKKFYIHFSYLPEDQNKEFPIVFWIHTNAKYKADELRICNKAARNLATLALTSGIDSKFVNETIEKANADYPHNRLGRMVSLCLRHNIPREDILVSLMNIDGDNISSLLTAVRKFLSETLPDGTVLKGLKCPECGAALIMQENCKRCSSCMWTACG